ncbi:MAG: MFS transporter [Halovenus sp.]
MATERGRSRIGRLWELLWSDGRGWVLLAVSVGWALTIGARIVYPALLPAIRAEFGFGYTTAGVLVGLVWAAYGALQLPGGILADTTSHRTALVVGTVLTAVGIVAVVGAPLFGLLVLATVVMGAGTGIYGPSRVAVLSNTYPDNGSTAIGVSQAAGNLGNAILPVAAGVLTVYAGWRAGLGYLVVGLAVSALALWMAVPVPSPTGQSTATVRELLARTRTALRSRPVYYGTGLLLLLMFVYQSLTGFLPTYFVDEKGLSPETAATLYGGFFAAAVVFQLGAGPLADRFGIQRVVALSAAASLPGFALVLVADGLGVLVAGTVLLGCLLGCFPPAHAYTVGVVPSPIQGTGYGAIRTVYIGCGAAGPVVTGVVAEFVSFPVAVGGLGVLVAGIVLVG